MPVHRVVVSPRQLKEALEVLRKPSHAGFNLDKLLTVIQALAILGAGTWTLFQYMAFQRHLNDTLLKQSTIDEEIKELEANMKGIEWRKEARDLDRSTKYRFDRSSHIDVRRMNAV